ncbi:hypothetical protein EPUL_006060, partial [Erysiphe pulchra]
MHIPATALYVILLPMLGGSRIAHAYGEQVSAEQVNTEQVNAGLNQNVLDATNDVFQCSGRVYSKPIIYATANHFCSIFKRRPFLRFLNPKEAGYRNGFYDGMVGETIDQYEKSIVPILEDGTLYPFSMWSPFRNLAGEMDKIDPGPDRLIIGQNCKIIGAFTDLDYGVDVEVPRIEYCRLLRSTQGYASPSSPQRSRETSPTGRSRGPSPGRIPQRLREQSPESFVRRSREGTL